MTPIAARRRYVACLQILGDPNAPAGERDSAGRRIAELTSAHPELRELVAGALGDTPAPRVRPAPAPPKKAPPAKKKRRRVRRAKVAAEWEDRRRSRVAAQRRSDDYGREPVRDFVVALAEGFLSEVIRDLQHQRGGADPFLILLDEDE